MFHFLFFFIVNASEDNKDVKHNTNLITTLLGKRCYLGTWSLLLTWLAILFCEESVNIMGFVNHLAFVANYSTMVVAQKQYRQYIKTVAVSMKLYLHKPAAGQFGPWVIVYRLLVYSAILFNWSQTFWASLTSRTEKTKLVMALKQLSIRWAEQMGIWGETQLGTS